MCIGCMQMFDKSALIRIVRDNENNISIDAFGKKNGRGAYICKSQDCLNKVIKANKLARAFSMQISNEVYDTLKKELEAVE